MGRLSHAEHVDSEHRGGVHERAAADGRYRAIQPVHAERGQDSVEGDWSVISSQPTFAEGIAAMSPIAAAAGWGRWEPVTVDPQSKTAVFRTYNNWEGLYQKQLGVCWGSEMMAGKFAGICSRLFGTPCWAEQTTFTARGDAYDEFAVAPSTLTMTQRLHELFDAGHGTQADLSAALSQLRRGYRAPEG